MRYNVGNARRNATLSTLAFIALMGITTGCYQESVFIPAYVFVALTLVFIHIPAITTSHPHEQIPVGLLFYLPRNTYFSGNSFRCPSVPLIPLLGIAANTFMMFSLRWMTWVLFVIWFSIGMTIYFAYGYKHSTAAEKVALVIKPISEVKKMNSAMLPGNDSQSSVNSNNID